MSTTPSTFPTLNPNTTQPQTVMYTTQPQTTQPQTIMYTTQPQTTQPQTIMYTTQPQPQTVTYTTQTPSPYGGTTMYTQPSVIPNPSQYPPQYPGVYPPQYPQPYGGYYGGGYTQQPQQPFQITAPYGTAPIIMTPGTSLPPVTMSGNDIKFIDGKKCRRVVKLKSI
jgi:hypothetical protein